MDDIRKFASDLSLVDKISTKELESKLSDIIANIDSDVCVQIAKVSKKIADENNVINESDSKLKKSAKELVGEILPSLSFYPALGIWGMVDKMIQTGEGFNSLTPEQQRLFPVYVTLFFGLVGSKIAYNRLIDMIKEKENNKQIDEVLQIAGIKKEV